MIQDEYEGFCDPFGFGYGEDTFNCWGYGMRGNKSGGGYGDLIFKKDHYPQLTRETHARFMMNLKSE